MKNVLLLFLLSVFLCLTACNLPTDKGSDSTGVSGLQTEESSVFDKESESITSSNAPTNENSASAPNGESESSEEISKESSGESSSNRGEITLPEIDL